VLVSFVGDTERQNLGGHFTFFARSERQYMKRNFKMRAILNVRKYFQGV
jgi:hypothetical protein